MAKKRKAKKSDKLQTLPADLSALAGAPIAALKARASEAVSAAVSTFDERTASAFVFSGKDASPMGSEVSVSDKGAKIRVMVSRAPVRLQWLQVSPDLSVDTTGARRQPVRVTGVNGRVVEVPRGFIWDTLIFQRQGKKIVNAKSFLVKSLADPSPAYALGKSSESVSSAALQALSGILNDAGENRK